MSSPIPFDIEQLLAACRPGTLIMTANRRLARHIEQAYNQHQLAAGKQAWQPLNLYPLDDWINAQWKKLTLLDSNELTHSRLLSTQEELLHWEAIIKHSQDTLPVARPAALARLAQQAYNNLGLWQLLNPPSEHTPLKDEPLFQQGTIDSQAFAKWLIRFNQICHEQQLMPQVSMQQTILAAFQQQQLLPYPDVLLVGFDQLSPLHEALLEAATETYRLLPHRDQTADCTHLACENHQAELWAAARWAQRELAASDAETSMAVIVPDLNQRREQVERIFNAVLEPQAILPDTPRYTPPFNISAGVPLSRTPVIASALAILALNRPNPPLQDWLALLHTPFSSLAFSETVELKLRDAGLPNLSCHKVLALLAGSSTSTPYTECLQRLQTANPELGKPWFKQSLVTWLDCFIEQLSACGWPGARALDSVEHQQLASWQRALIELKQQAEQLPTIPDAITASEALGLLQRHLEQVSFQPESSSSPLQILGLLEASGLHFEQLWLVGMNDHLLPANPAPNPLIPLALQRQHQLPHATPERELRITQQLIESYQHNCNRLIASYAQWEGDQPLRPSALISDDLWQPADNDLIELATTDNCHPYQPLIHQDGATALSSFIDELAPPVSLDNERITGGSGIVKSQSGCPFQAFAQYRLDAWPLAETDTYDLAMERGTCLHQALELIWGELVTLERLNSISHSELTALIEQASEQAIAPLARQRPDLYQPRFTELEQQRLQRLLVMWLDLEAQRAPFEVIAREHALDMFIGQLPIRLRIDRVDRLANGSLALIDYKTGTGSVTDWDGERPREPQLPLYSVMLEQQQTLQGEVSTVCFARINIKEPGYIGLGDEQQADPMTLKKSRTPP